MAVADVLYRWLDGIFCIGRRRDLQQSDLYAHPSEADSEKLLKQFNRSVSMARSQIDQLDGSIMYIIKGKKSHLCA